MHFLPPYQTVEQRKICGAGEDDKREYRHHVRGLCSPLTLAWRVISRLCRLKVAGCFPDLVDSKWRCNNFEIRLLTGRLLVTSLDFLFVFNQKYV